MIDSLGAAVRHGSHWLPFFMAFAFVMTAMRVLIAWVYSITGSILPAQIMHVSSTGAPGDLQKRGSQWELSCQRSRARWSSALTVFELKTIQFHRIVRSEGASPSASFPRVGLQEFLKEIGNGE